jgi:hypothetical protein
MPQASRRRHLVVLGALFFLATRIVVYSSAEPFFDPDSYKYLSGADSLRQGHGLSPLFTTVAVTGGALHAMPGYAWFVYAIWTVCDGVNLHAVTVVQSVIALMGYLCLAHLFTRWAGLGAGVMVFIVLSLSPSLAWLERTLMPDAIAAPLLLIALWAAFMGAPAAEPPRRSAAAALGAGLLMSFEVLLRTSSQVYVPFPPLLAVQTRSEKASAVAVWLLLYIVGLVVPLVPWILHNDRAHHVYGMSHSTGRNMYFSAAWAGTIDRDRARQELGLPPIAGPRAAYSLTDAQLDRALRASGSLPVADDRLRELAVEAYRNKSLSDLAAERLSILSGLFVDDAESGVSLSPLQTHRDWYLENPTSAMGVRQKLEKRFQYTFSPEFVRAASERRKPNELARRLHVLAIDNLTLDGVALLVLYALSIVIIYRRSLSRWPILLAVAAPPSAFLVTYAFFGAPLYRYQAGLHPFMLAAFVASVVPFLTRQPSRKRPKSLLERRLWRIG